MKYWKLIGHIAEEGTTFAPAAGPMQTSPFRPPLDGKLTGVRLVAAPAAVTSLLNGLHVRLNCVEFTPNTIDFFINGGGLQTAPRPALPHIDYEVNQTVKAGSDINVESRNLAEGDTPVTVNVAVMGLFEN